MTSPLAKPRITQSELHSFKYDWTGYLLGEARTAVVDGVTFSKFSATPKSTLSFSYKNAHGLIFPNNGYVGHFDGEGVYYFMVNISPHYSNEAKYGGNCMPALKAMANKIKYGWNLFTK